MKYLDFDLLIDKADAAYSVRVLRSPMGSASSRFVLPFSDIEIENVLLKLSRVRRGMRRLESPEMEAARGFGGRLFDAVFSEETRSLLRSSLSEANRQDAGLRLRLRFGDAPELMELPWEYLYDRTGDHFFVLSSETPLVRYLEVAEPVRPPVVEPPLQILFMAANPPGYPPLEVDREWQKLQDSVAELERQHLVHLTRLADGSLATLQRQLRHQQYHVFHFVGHGAFDHSAQDGVLLFEGEGSQGRPVAGRDLGVLLKDQRFLRLALLNACEGARTARGDPFAGVAQSLVQKGIPAVVAMQFEITDEAAITLAREFYSAIADGYPVDAALTEARKAIFASASDIEWGTPVLYLSAPDGVIFDLARMPGVVSSEPSAAPALESESRSTIPAASTVMAPQPVRSSASEGRRATNAPVRRAGPSLAFSAEVIRGALLLGLGWFAARFMVDSAEWIRSLEMYTYVAKVIFGLAAGLIVMAVLWTVSVSWRPKQALIVVGGWLAGGVLLDIPWVGLIGAMIGGLCTGWALHQLEPGFEKSDVLNTLLGWPLALFAAMLIVGIPLVVGIEALGLWSIDPGEVFDPGASLSLINGLAGAIGGWVLLAQLSAARRRG